MTANLQDLFDQAGRNPPARALDADAVLHRARARRSRNRRITGAVTAVVAVTLALGVGLASERLVSADLATEPIDKPTETASSGPTPAPEDASWPATMYFLDISTGAQTLVAGDLLSEVVDNAYYVFSPDGTKVAYNTCSEGPCSRQNELRVGDADGTRTDAAFEGEHAIAWTPDGTKLVYSAPNTIWHAEDPSLYVRDLATGETTRLLDAGTAGWLRDVDFGPNSVDVSPDGGSVVFARPRDSSRDVTAWDVWAVPITGGEPTLLLRDAPDRAKLWGLYAPQYLADGERIAFPQSDRLISVAAPGQPPQPLVTTEVPIYAYALSPDRTRIAYSTEEGTHVVDLATGADTLVSDGTRARWAGNDTLFVEVPY